MRMVSIIWGFVDIDCNSFFHVTDCESIHTHGHNLRLYLFIYYYARRQHITYTDRKKHQKLQNKIHQKLETIEH